jgi:hypothetical protein
VFGQQEEWVSKRKNWVGLMTNSIFVLSVTCLAMLVSPFVATAAPMATAPVAQAEMNARVAAATDLLEAMGGRKSVMEQIDRVIPAQMAALQTQFPSITTDTRRIIESSMRTEMTHGVNRLLSQMAGAWARRFTAAEMREIAAFHRSPAGRHLREHQAELQREISEIGRSWGADISRKLQERLNDYMKQPQALTS